MGVDALATSYPGMNPYNFVMGNPIMAIDPDGNRTDSIYDEDENGMFKARITDHPDGGSNIDTWNYNDGTILIHNKMERRITQVEIPEEMLRSNRAMERPLELYTFDEVFEAAVGRDESLIDITDEIVRRFNLADIVGDLVIGKVFGLASYPVQLPVRADKIINTKVDYALRKGLEQLGAGSAVLVPIIDDINGEEIVTKIELIQFQGYDNSSRSVFHREELKLY